MLMSADGVDQRPAQQDRHGSRAGDDPSLVAVRLEQRNCFSRRARPQEGDRAGHLERVASAAGGMFWFTRKKLVGSYVRLSVASRA